MVEKVDKDLKPYFGVGKIPKGFRRGSMKEAADAKQVRYYGLKVADTRIVENAYKKKVKDSVTLNALFQQRAELKGKLNKIKKSFEREKDPDKRKTLNDEYRKLVVDLKNTSAKLEAVQTGQKVDLEEEKKDEEEELLQTKKEIQKLEKTIREEKMKREVEDKKLSNIKLSVKKK